MLYFQRKHDATRIFREDVTESLEMIQLALSRFVSKSTSQPISQRTDVTTSRQLVASAKGQNITKSACGQCVLPKANASPNNSTTVAASLVHKCHSCQQSFPSRTKLFKRLKALRDHYTRQEPPPTNTNQQAQVVQVQDSTLGASRQSWNLLGLIGVYLLLLFAIISTRASSFSQGPGRLLPVCLTPGQVLKVALT
jgi:hypothetical protein